MMMPVSYSKTMGPSINTMERASGGVRNAAMIAPITSASGRCRANVFGSIKPRALKITMTSGSSNNRPNATISWAAKLKYASAVIMNSRSWC